jgi:hypothetical protein
MNSPWALQNSVSWSAKERSTPQPPESRKFHLCWEYCMAREKEKQKSDTISSVPLGSRTTWITTGNFFIKCEWSPQSTRAYSAFNSGWINIGHTYLLISVRSGKCLFTMGPWLLVRNPTAIDQRDIFSCRLLHWISTGGTKKRRRRRKMLIVLIM